MASPSSSAQQALEALGAQLREIRTDAGLTGRDLGRLASWHSSKVSRIEHARQTPSAEDVTAWCKHCEAPQRAPDLIAALRAAEGMFVEWQRMERTGLRVAQESVVPLWERTRRLRIYSSSMIPGPVQTAAYIRALLHALRVRRDLPDDVEAAVKVRVAKQHVIHEGDHRFAIVLEEGVLRYRIGDTPPIVVAATARGWIPPKDTPTTPSRVPSTRTLVERAAARGATSSGPSR